MISDVAAEAVVVAGPFAHGRDAFLDCEPFVNRNSFTVPWNEHIWACMEEFYKEGDDRTFDVTSLVSTARKLGLSSTLDNQDAKQHIRALLNTAKGLQLRSIRPEAAKLLRLRVAQSLDDILVQSRKKLNKITGDETLNAILGLVEDPVFEYTSGLSSEGHGTRLIGDGVIEWLEDRIEHPRENVGIPSPYARYNAMIGGGFRRRSISMLAARAKMGKSIFIDNVCLHIAGTLDIPVLNVDTEMSDEEHWARILAHLTGFPIDLIESGKVTKGQAKKLRQQAQWLTSIPYHYRSVIDETFEEQVSAMRRWIIKNVSVDGDGVRNNCLVAYDYLQLTDPREFGDSRMAEYQILGFQMVALTRLAKRYDVPILSALQLNRAGINEETTAAASGSDRIIWKCGNFSILKKKDREADSDFDEGNMKLIPLIARHGPACEQGDYINLKFDGITSRLIEGRTRFELEAERDGKTINKPEFPTEDEEAEFVPL